MSTPAFHPLSGSCARPDGPAVLEVPSLSAEEAGRLASDLAARSIEARVIDGRTLAGKDDLLRELAGAFGFPGYFGHNWDALVDCLSDLSWLPAKGYVCVLLGADAFHARDPAAHDTLRDVWQDAAERWRQHEPGTVFKLVLGKGA